MSDAEVVVVGAGLAGLACARTLAAAGVDVVVLEAGDGVGGRVRTDVVDGHLLDRGFQVVLTAYPELARQLDVDALALRPFEPGALVQRPDGRARVGDPLRRPWQAPATLAAPVGSLADKVRVLRWLASVRSGPPAALLGRPDGTTAARLDEVGFSPAMVDGFWRPLLGGITLDPTLATSRRMTEIVLRMLATGRSAVPAAGMQAIPDHLAAGLAPATVRLGHRVERLDGTAALVADGGRIAGEALVVATEGPAAAALLDLPTPGSRPAACLWFAMDEAPVDEPTLVLDGTGAGPVRNLAPMSVVAPTYAPAGRHLVAAAVPGPDALRPGLAEAARRQMTAWFGPRVDTWDLLRVDVIPHGQPDQAPPLHPRQRVDLGQGRFVCGDHRDTASSQGALFSGRRTAEAVLARLGRC